jgi:hypothetical protein
LQRRDVTRYTPEGGIRKVEIAGSEVEIAHPVKTSQKAEARITNHLPTNGSGWSHPRSAVFAITSIALPLEFSLVHQAKGGAERSRATFHLLGTPESPDDPF